MKETYLKIILALCIVACLVLAIVLPMSAATARPYAWSSSTTALTEFNARTWSLYGLDFDDYENFPTQGPLGDTATLTFAFDGLIVTKHQYNATTSQNDFVRSWLFIADYRYPGYMTIDQENGNLYVDWGEEDYFEANLYTGEFSVWFVPLGYLTDTQTQINASNLADFEENLTSHGLSVTLYDYRNTAHASDRTAQGSYNLLYRQQAIIAKNADDLEYSRGFDSGYRSGKDQGFTQGKAEGERIGYAQAESDALESRETLMQFIGSIFTAPSHLINTIFDFEIFGFNVASLVKFVLTMLIVGLVTGWLIRKGV